MESLKEAVFALNVKAEVDAMKRREIALYLAIQGMEKERIQMIAKLFDANRCTDCVRLNDCKQKKGETTYKAKQRAPESFCVMWDYGGEYTPMMELLSLVKQTRGGKEA